MPRADPIRHRSLRVRHAFRRIQTRPLNATPNVPTALAIALGLTAALSGCSSHPDATASTTQRAELTGITRDSAGIRILTLSHTPHEIAMGMTRATPLSPELRVGYGRPGWSGLAADLASLGAGRFAILDRTARRLVVFDSLGHEIDSATATRDTHFPAPLALAAAGEHLIAWQAIAEPAFTVIAPAGGILATGAATLPGDWALARDPDLGTAGVGPRLGPEDLTRRLAALGDTGFVHLLQVSERDYDDEPAPFPWSAPPAHLIRYGLDARVRDTLATLAGAPTLRYKTRRWDRRAQQEVEVTRWRQPLYSGRPVWAIGDGWIALGHGDSAQLVVRRIAFDTRPAHGARRPTARLAGDTALIIRWPEQRLPVSAADRREAALGVIVHRLLNSGNVQKFLESESRQGLRQGIEREVERHLDFAELAPTLTAAYAAGDCLFLAGYAPADWPDGTSLTWVALNLRRGSVEGVFRLAPAPLTLRGSQVEMRRRAAATRAFDAEFAFTTARGRDGTTVVERYRLPELDCER